MAKVTMHEANDGSLHKKAKDCDAHNVKLRMAPALAELLGELHDNDARFRNVVAENGDQFAGISTTDLACLIVDHADAIRKILNDALVSRRPRKPKLAVVQTVQAAAA